MSKEPRYRDGGDAGARLHKTILRYKGLPVQLSQWDGMLFVAKFLDTSDKKIFTEELKKSKEKFGVNEIVIDANDPNLDVESPPTGYINVYADQIAQVAFLSRMPVRRYYQGLHTTNTSIVNEYNGLELVQGRADWPVASKFLAAMIKGEYPSAEKCLETLKDDDSEGLAFTRKLAFVRSPNAPQVIQLRFQSQPVGFVKPDQKHPTVTLMKEWEAYNILKSSLMNAGVFVE